MLIRRLTAKVSGPTSRVRQGALDAVAALLDTDVGSAYLMIPGGDRSTYRASKKAKYMEHLLRRTIFLFVPVTVCALLLVWGKVSHGFCASGVGPLRYGTFVSFSWLCTRSAFCAAVVIPIKINRAEK